MPPSETTMVSTVLPELARAPQLVLPSRLNRARGLLARIDFVLAALGALLLGLATYSGAQALATLHYVANELAQIAPWLAASVMVAAAAQATGADALAARVFTGRQSRMIVVASVIGALLPFCSCGVIPLVAGLLAAGVPLAPVMAFWVSSPLMDPAQFFIAAGVLGLSFAVAKMIAAVGMGLLSGFGTMTLIRMGWLDAPAALRSTVTAAKSACCGSKAAPMPLASKSCCGSSPAQTVTTAARSCCGTKQSSTSTIVWRFWTEPARSQRFLTIAVRTGWFLLRWLAVAYALESLMVAWLPTGMVGNWLGAGAGLLAVPLAVLIGVPVYLNSFAAIPFVSGLVNLGMNPATGLAFMLASSATGFPAMVAVWALVKPRAFALYIGFAVTGALLAGYAYTAALALGH
jgi:uncharacterized membrane protein YraQ (UPF0718 family)